LIGHSSLNETTIEKTCRPVKKETRQKTGQFLDSKIEELLQWESDKDMIAWLGNL
jgi:hypothetical protein